MHKSSGSCTGMKTYESEKKKNPASSQGFFFLCCTVLYCIILYYTVLYYTVLYYIILSFAVQGETGVADSPYFFFFSVL